MIKRNKKNIKYLYRPGISRPIRISTCPFHYEKLLIVKCSPPSYLHKTNLYQAAVTSRPSLVDGSTLKSSRSWHHFCWDFPSNVAKVLTQQTRKKNCHNKQVYSRYGMITHTHSWQQTTKICSRWGWWIFVSIVEVPFATLGDSFEYSWVERIPSFHWMDQEIKHLNILQTSK